jgi:hypothetical protein
MKTVSSSEFRVTFGKIAEPTTVTVLGRPIGRWVPVGFETTQPDEVIYPVQGTATNVPPPNYTVTSETAGAKNTTSSVTNVVDPAWSETAKTLTVGPKPGAGLPTMAEVKRGRK